MLLALALVGAGSASAAKDNTVWLCKPGLADNPCKPGFETTTISPTGEVLGVDDAQGRRKPKVDCFYVYPTVSDDQTPNSDLSIDPEERSIALYQAARYSQHCRVFAPMYRQITLPALFGGEPSPTRQAELAYDDVRQRLEDYLAKYNDGRGVILIGHSQGTYVLRQLIHDQVDPKPGVRKRLVSAILLGGNVVVDEGGDVGGDFKHVPRLRAAEADRLRDRVLDLQCAGSAGRRVRPPERGSRPGPARDRRRPLHQPGGARRRLRRRCARSSRAPRSRPGRRSALATEVVGVPRPPVTTPWTQVRAPTPASARRPTTPTCSRSARSAARRS